MIPGLVSIITPCYNGEKYLKRYFDSILKQTYKNIEIIFIDDGSIDSSRKIASEYSCEFHKQGMRFLYLYQENKGQAAAINFGLNEVQGEFLVWPDCDDWLSENSIEKRVTFLQNNTDYNVVACAVAFYEESNFNLPLRKSFWEHNENKLFYDVLLSNVICYSGVYMVRTEKLFSALKGRKIIESRIGQNWQLLLPILYHNKCGFMNEILHNCLVHQESHSHSIYGKQQWIERIEQYKYFMELILGTISMTEIEKDSLLKHFYDKCDIQLFLNSIREDGEISKKEIEIFQKFFISLSNLRKKNVWVWGAGLNGKMLTRWLKNAADIDVVGYIDSEKGKISGLKYCGKSVMCFSEYEKDEDVFLIIPIAKYNNIIEELKNRGFRMGIDYCYPNYEIAMFDEGN